MTPTPDDATDWSLMGPLYRDRIIELEASIAELKAENKRLKHDELTNTNCQVCHYWPCKCPRG